MYAALGLDRIARLLCLAGTQRGYGRRAAARTNRRWLARADGMITDQPGLPLAMRYADCTPILLYDPVRHAAGSCTPDGAGRSWAPRRAPSAPCRMRSAQSGHPGRDRAEHRAGCYRVGEEVVEAVREAFGTIDGLIKRAADGSAYLDLWAANRLALERAGVVQIEVAGICTATRTDEFYSHRAEKGRTGRFGAVIALAE